MNHGFGLRSMVLIELSSSFQYAVIAVLGCTFLFCDMQGGVCFMFVVPVLCHAHVSVS